MFDALLLLLQGRICFWCLETVLSYHGRNFNFTSSSLHREECFTTKVVFLHGQEKKACRVFQVVDWLDSENGHPALNPLFDLSFSAQFYISHPVFMEATASPLSMSIATLFIHKKCAVVLESSIIQFLLPNQAKVQGKSNFIAKNCQLIMCVTHEYFSHSTNVNPYSISSTLKESASTLSWLRNLLHRHNQCARSPYTEIQSLINPDSEKQLHLYLSLFLQACIHVNTVLPAVRFCWHIVAIYIWWWRFKRSDAYH